jgi:hypothetical protein
LNRQSKLVLAPRNKWKEKEAQSATEALSLMIVGGKLSFNFILSPYFRHFVAIVQPAYTVPSNIPDLIDEHAKLVQKDVKERLSKGLAYSFTMDGWSAHRAYFLAIAVHFVTSTGTMDHALLPVIRMKEAHTASNMNVQFRSELSKFLSVDENELRMGGITTDNATNMEAFGNLCDFTWVSCFAHSLNLFVKDVVIEDAEAMFSKLRALVVKFRTSHHFIEALTTAQKNKGTKVRALKLDVPTRWNSLYHMLIRCVEEKDSIYRALVYTLKLSCWCRK